MKFRNKESGKIVQAFEYDGYIIKDNVPDWAYLAFLRGDLYYDLSDWGQKSYGLELSKLKKGLGI